MKLVFRTFVGLGLGVLLLGCQHPAAQPAASRQTFRVLTYNIHHGEGLDGRVDLARIAGVITNSGADIVALQEVDKGVTRTQKRDFPSELATLTGLSCVFSNNFHYQGGEYGNALLTRFPILSATNSLYQMIRKGEQRGLLQLTLDIHGRRVLVLNTHIDSRGDDAERWLNLDEVFTLIRLHGDSHVVLCGDFNDQPESRVHAKLSRGLIDSWDEAGTGAGHSFPAQQPAKRIDYIWHSRVADLHAKQATVLESLASDHRPVLVEFSFE